MDHKKDFDQFVYWMSGSRWKDNYEEALKSAAVIRSHWYSLSEIELSFFKDSMEALKRTDEDQK